MSRRIAVASMALIVASVAACATAPDTDRVTERIGEAVPDVTAEVTLGATASPGLSNLSVVLDVAEPLTADEVSDVLAAILADSLSGIGQVSLGAYSSPGECVDLGAPLEQLGLSAYAFDRHGVEECTSLLINRNNLEEWWRDQ